MSGSSETVKMWLNVFVFFNALVHCLYRGHPNVFVGSVGLPFYYAVGALDVGCQTNKLGEMLQRSKHPGREVSEGY